jgi:enoyl-CoA hydratase/carnithine racemase
MQTLIVRKIGEIGWIRFFRPDVRNAVNLTMMEELERVIHEWEKENRLKAIVFYGDKQSFVSGGDIAEFQRWTQKEEIFPVMERMGTLLERISQLDCLTIAAVQGAAVGGGCEMVASCDFCLASPQARFGMIQVKLGITTGWGGAHRLMRKIGTAPALELLLTGEVVSAARAKDWGLVDHLLSEESFLEEVEIFVTQLTQAPKGVISAYKKLVRQFVAGVDSSVLLKREAEHCADLWESEEHQKAVESFLSRTRK